MVRPADLAAADEINRAPAEASGVWASRVKGISDCGIPVDMARRRLTVPKTSFILWRLPPHQRNFNKQMIRSPTFYFYDSGLLCRLLGIREASQILSHSLRGPLRLYTQEEG